MMRALKQWLEDPNTNAGPVASEARSDLAWLEKSKDLSSVNLRNSEKPASMASIKAKAEGEVSSGGFAAWFQQCAGKRK